MFFIKYFCKLSLALVIGFYGLSSSAHTVDELDSKQQAVYGHLTKTLRCVTCPNQAIADSHAPVAESMREEVLEKVLAGQTDEEIIDYFVKRYGEYVVYQPSFSAKTFILWVGPFIFMLLGGAILAYQVFRGKTKSHA